MDKKSIKNDNEELTAEVIRQFNLSMEKLNNCKSASIFYTITDKEGKTVNGKLIHGLSIAEIVGTLEYNKYDMLRESQLKNVFDSLLKDLTKK